MIRVVKQCVKGWSPFAFPSLAHFRVPVLAVFYPSEPATFGLIEVM